MLSFTESVPGKAAALEICTDGGGLILINVHGPQAGCSPGAGRAAFWADIRMYATARSLGGRRPMVTAGHTNVYMDATSHLATENLRAGWEACGFGRATAGGVEDMSPTLHPSRHRKDTFLVNEPLLPWSLRGSVWARGMAHPQVIGSDHLPVRLALPGLLNAERHTTMPTPYSHTEGRLLPYDAEAEPVQRCLWAVVTAGQDEPFLASPLGPAEQHAYGSMPAAAVGKVFEHLHAGHDALARTVGRRQPSPAGSDLAGGDPPESGKWLQAAILRYDALAACAPAAYQGKRGPERHHKPNPANNMSTPSVQLSAMTWRIRSVQVQLGSSGPLSMSKPKLRVASGYQEDPGHRRAEQEAHREIPIPLTTEALAARGDSLQHLRRRVAVFNSRSACPAPSSTAVGGSEEQDEQRRRLD